MSSKTSNDVEEDLNDPAWKPLKSKRQMFESAQNSPNPISNTEGRKTHTSRVSNTKRLTGINYNILYIYLLFFFFNFIHIIYIYINIY